MVKVHCALVFLAQFANCQNLVYFPTNSVYFLSEHCGRPVDLMSCLEDVVGNGRHVLLSFSGVFFVLLNTLLLTCGPFPNVYLRTLLAANRVLGLRLVFLIAMAFPEVRRINQFDYVGI